MTRPSQPKMNELIARSEIRDQVQILALVGIGECHGFVELDTKARLRGRDDVAILPTDSLLQDLGVEAAPLFDAFQDQEVRAAGADLYVGGADHGSTVEMRSDLGIEGLRHAGDLL